MNPKISVIIPVYNAQKTLEATVSSVLRCSYRPLEVILVDDGSTDGSFKICDKLANRVKNVSSYHMNNGGAAFARNKGIELSTGEFIAFIDSDDLVSADYFDVLYKLICDYDADIAVCDYRKIYEKDFKALTFSHHKHQGGKSVPYKSDENSYIDTYCFDRSQAVKNLLYQRYFMSTPCCMISKRALWRDLKFPEGVRAEDVATIYKLFYNAKKVAFINKKLYYYYQRPESTVYSTFNRLNPDYLKNCRDIVEFMKKNMPDAVPAAYSRLFSACFQILSQTKKDKDNGQFCSTVYDVIKKIRGRIIKDRNGKPRNRLTAAASYFGLPLIHFMLRVHYYINTSKLQNGI